MDGAALDALIDQIQNRWNMNLKVESRDVSAFIGIQFTKQDSTMELKQLGLIDRIQDVRMEDCNPSETPADVKTLGKNKDGAPSSKFWNYRSVIGHLLYLAGNSWPDIAFAVHQIARFFYEPNNPMLLRLSVSFSISKEQETKALRLILM